MLFKTISRVIVSINGFLFTERVYSDDFDSFCEKVWEKDGIIVDFQIVEIMEC